MKLHILAFLTFLGFLSFSFVSPTVHAKRCGSMKNDSSHCGLWLCIPASMGPGCAAMVTALGKRMSRGCPPLPSYGTCAGGGGNEGSYEKGYEKYYPCRAGTTVAADTKSCQKRNMKNSECRSSGGQFSSVSFDERNNSRNERGTCYYPRQKRKFPYWVEIKIGEKEYTRFWHNKKGRSPDSNVNRDTALPKMPQIPDVQEMFAVPTHESSNGTLNKSGSAIDRKTIAPDYSSIIGTGPAATTGLKEIKDINNAASQTKGIIPLGITSSRTDNLQDLSESIQGPTSLINSNTFGSNVISNYKNNSDNASRNFTNATPRILIPPTTTQPSSLPEPQILNNYIFQKQLQPADVGQTGNTNLSSLPTINSSILKRQTPNAARFSPSGNVSSNGSSATHNLPAVNKPTMYGVPRNNVIKQKPNNETSRGILTSDGILNSNDLPKRQIVDDY